jgi:hypothetical protein
MRRALVLEPTGLDTRQLVSWGEELILFPAGCLPAHHPEFKQTLLERLDEIEYDEHDDAFAVVGKASKLARACAVLACEYSSAETWPIFLYWNDAKLRYSPIEEKYHA